ncbi:DMT family transporter [Candidatus Enterovibrio altilux]|uniref:DMT family transporter n=1 Tax=Candidatus Enterovibrio altilux TaxID=1927128 RepID=UPI001237A2A2|nr:DMT family transporter [Candidatus Enterovibrio luxaltus]
MGYLAFITLLWAFSFSLIGVYLTGQVDEYFSVMSRVVLATLVFLPFLRLKGIPKSLMLKLMVIGALQLGLMYCFYYQSFLYLSVPEVLIFTVFTPIYITLTYDIIHRRFSPWYLMTALLAVLGAMVIKFTSVNPHFLLGFLIVQCANLFFAIGQVSYKVIVERAYINVPQHTIFGFFYLGALCVVVPAFLLLGNQEKFPTKTNQWLILVYLGTVASGMGYFLWNKGVTLVNAGALAVMNNVLVPTGIVINLVIWNQDTDLITLSIGGSLILLSLWLNETWVKKSIALRMHNTNFS